MNVPLFFSLINFLVDYDVVQRAWELPPSWLRLLPDTHLLTCAQVGHQTAAAWFSRDWAMLGDGYSHVVVATCTKVHTMTSARALKNWGQSGTIKSIQNWCLYIFFMRPPCYVEHVEFSLSCAAKYCILFFSSFRVHFRSHLSFPLLLALTSTPNPLSVF